MEQHDEISWSQCDTWVGVSGESEGQCDRSLMKAVGKQKTQI